VRHHKKKQADKLAREAAQRDAQSGTQPTPVTEPAKPRN
jgi:hypothetical protein